MIFSYFSRTKKPVIDAAMKGYCRSNINNIILEPDLARLIVCCEKTIFAVDLKNTSNLLWSSSPQKKWGSFHSNPRYCDPFLFVPSGRSTVKIFNSDEICAQIPAPNLEQISVNDSQLFVSRGRKLLTYNFLSAPVKETQLKREKYLH